MKVAAVTMGYNEPDFLPIWARHYSAQVGAKNCYYIDHGSDDGSTDAPSDINIVRIPRSPYESPRSARFMSNFCSSLLEWYDFVLHTDVDEMVVADPAVADSLTSYCESCNFDAVTAIGFNLLHTGDESPIEQSTSRRPKTVLERRSWVCFSAAMCKPVLSRKPIVWNPGFHRADDIATTLDDLYLFHLRFFDRDIGLRRLAKTRDMPWADLDDGWWQRIPDPDCLEMFARYDGLPRNNKVRLGKKSPQVLEALRQTFGPQDSGIFHINYEAEELWPLPKRFRPIF
jgi:hypothetical protein